MIVVGLAGRISSGKGSVAKALVERLGFTEIAFADPLKDFAAAAFNLDRMKLSEERYKESKTGSIHDEYLTPRSILQRLGVAARAQFGEGFWVDQCFKQMRRLAGEAGPHGKAPRFVVSDVRFFNELAAVRSLAATAEVGLLIRTNRADRKHAHAFVDACKEPSERHGCTYWFEDLALPGMVRCGLPAKSHPSHFSGDTHQSETELPDSSSLYDFEIEQDSGEKAGLVAAAWVATELERRGIK